jgi:site-specific DNA-methyltransferase (adenine-specific)
MLELNKIYCGDCLEVMKKLPDKCVDLVLTDPPYFEIKGEFDFGKWKNFEEYLMDVEKWAVECKRILKENGTLLWFGDEKRIAYTQIIFDKYFGLLNNLVWEITDMVVQNQKFNKTFNSFPICTERALVYSNDVYNLTQCIYTIRDYIRSEIMRAKGKIILKDINTALGTATNGGGVASACLSLDKKEPAMFTKEMYEKLRIWLNDSKEYEYLRKEYEDLRRYFNNEFNLSEIIRNSRELGHKIEHETVKPLHLIEKLILTCSKENDLILDPFLGSGTTAVACKNLKRNFIGIEISEKYCEIAKQRLRQQILL